MSKLEHIVVNDDAYLLNIIGPSGSGKTQKMFHIMESWYPLDTTFAFRNYNEKLIKLFPESIRDRSITFSSFRDIIDTPCVVVLDDLPVQAYSNDFKSSSSQDFIRQLTFERHNDHKLIATSQNDQLVLKGLFQSVHVLNLISKMLPSQSDTVRNIELQKFVNETISIAEKFYPDVDKRSFCYCPETDEIFQFPYLDLHPDIGKPYRGYVVENGKLEYVGNQ